MSNYKITFKSNGNIQKIAKDCIDEHLYVNGWEFKKHLDTLYLFSKKEWKELEMEQYDIVVAYINNKAIGVMVLTDFSFNTFVKPIYRKQGIASLLYKEIIKITKRDYKNIPMRVGNKASIDFFKSIGHINIQLENTSSLTHTKTPEELLKWMDKNLTYKGENRDFLRTPEQLVKDKVGHCWETTELVNNELTVLGFTCQTLYMTNNQKYNDDTVTHSTLIYKDKQNKYYWFEWAWYKQAGIHGPYKNINEVLNFIIDKFIFQHKTITTAKLSNVGLIALTNANDYINNTDSWENVLPNKNFKPAFENWK